MQPIVIHIQANAYLDYLRIAHNHFLGKKFDSSNQLSVVIKKGHSELVMWREDSATGWLTVAHKPQKHIHRDLGLSTGRQSGHCRSMLVTSCKDSPYLGATKTFIEHIGKLLAEGETLNHREQLLIRFKRTSESGFSCTLERVADRYIN